MTFRDHLRLTGGILKAVFTTNVRTTTNVSLVDGRVVLREVSPGEERPARPRTFRDHLRLTGGILKAVFTTNVRTTTEVSLVDGRVVLRDLGPGEDRSVRPSSAA